MSVNWGVLQKRKNKISRLVIFFLYAQMKRSVSFEVVNERHFKNIFLFVLLIDDFIELLYCLQIPSAHVKNSIGPRKNVKK